MPTWRGEGEATVPPNNAVGSYSALTCGGGGVGEVIGLRAGSCLAFLAPVPQRDPFCHGRERRSSRAAYFHWSVLPPCSSRAPALCLALVFSPPTAHLQRWGPGCQEGLQTTEWCSSGLGRRREGWWWECLQGRGMLANPWALFPRLEVEPDAMAAGPKVREVPQEHGGSRCCSPSLHCSWLEGGPLCSPDTFLTSC